MIINRLKAKKERIAFAPINLSVANGPDLHAAGWDAADQMRSGGRLPKGHRPHVRSNRQDHARMSRGRASDIRFGSFAAIGRRRADVRSYLESR
jgi:hypothetical protein